MVDEAYVEQLEKRIEEYENMLFMSNDDLDKSSNFTVLEVNPLLDELNELIKGCERATEVRNHQGFRKAWYVWRYKKIGRWNRSWYQKRMEVSFADWYASIFNDFLKKGDVLDRWSSKWWAIHKSDPFEDSLIRLRKMCNSINRRKKNVVFVKEEDMIMLDNARQYAESWQKFVNRRWNNRLPVSLKNIEQKMRNQR